MTATTEAVDGRRRRRVSDAQILGAAAAEFAGRGFAGASMAAVAERAGTTKPTLYANFGGKEQLYAATLAAETQALREHLIGTYVRSSQASMREQLRAGTGAIFTFAAERPDGFELMFGAGPGLPLADATLRQGYDDVVAAVAAMVAPRLPGRDAGHAHLLATMLVGLLHAAARAAVAGGLDLDAAAAVAESLVLHGLTGLDVALLDAV